MNFLFNISMVISVSSSLFFFLHLYGRSVFSCLLFFLNFFNEIRSISMNKFKIISFYNLVILKKIYQYFCNFSLLLCTVWVFIWFKHFYFLSWHVLNTEIGTSLHNTYFAVLLLLLLLLFNSRWRFKYYEQVHKKFSYPLSYLLQSTSLHYFQLILHILNLI